MSVLLKLYLVKNNEKGRWARAFSMFYKEIKQDVNGFGNYNGVNPIRCPWCITIELSNKAKAYMF